MNSCKKEKGGLETKNEVRRSLVMEVFQPKLGSDPVLSLRITVS